MPTYLFRNLQLLDPRFDEPRGGYEVLIEDGFIKEVSERPIAATNAQRIDCSGRTLMPGLIDCHVHVYLSEVNVSLLEHVPVSLLAARAAPLMLGMLNRGFTTVRDTGGADWGIREAVEKGHLAGPRLFISGRAIGPTGGHSDMRRRTDHHASLSLLSRAGDSRWRSPTAPITCVLSCARNCVRAPIRSRSWFPVASRPHTTRSIHASSRCAEIAAAVEEATAFKRYVLAHAYTAEAITRAVEPGRAHDRARQSDRHGRGAS